MDNFETAAPGSKPENLLNCFFFACEKEFRFLEQEYGFAYLSGMTQYRKGRRIFIPWKPHSEVVSPFEAATLYEKGDITFEILYSGGSFALAPYICYDRIHRFHFDEILRAARRSLFLHMQMPLVAQEVQLEKALQQMSPVVRRNISYVTDAAPKVIQRALQIREKRLEQKIREQFRKDMDETAREAARAFTDKNYRRVVELLMPYQRHLSFANMRKLQLARKYLLSV